MKRLISFFLMLIVGCILFDISFAEANVDIIDLVYKIINANQRDVLLHQFPSYSIYLYEDSGTGNFNLYQICYNDEDGQMTIDYTQQSTYVWEIYDDETNAIEYYPDNDQIIATVNTTGQKLWGGYFDLLEVGGIVRNYVDTQLSDDSIIVYARLTDEEANKYYGDLVKDYSVYVGYIANKATLLLNSLEIFCMDEKGNVKTIEIDEFEYGRTDDTIKAYNEVLKDYRHKVTKNISTRNVTVILNNDDGSIKRINQNILKGVQFYVETPANYSLYLDEQYNNAYNDNYGDLNSDITLYAATENTISKAKSKQKALTGNDDSSGTIKHLSILGGRKQANEQDKETTPSVAAATISSPDETSVQKNQVASKPVTLKISSKATLIDANHVGSHWSKQLYLNGEAINGIRKITVELGDKINIGYSISEEDKYPDTGSFSQTIEITPEIMNSGIKIEENIYVAENRGKYSGYKAHWKVVITIKP